MNYKGLQSATSQEALQNRTGITLLLVQGQSCPPCVHLCRYLADKYDDSKNNAQYIEQILSEKFGLEARILITECNSEFMSLIQKTGIRSIPTIILMKNGQIQGKFSTSREQAQKYFIEQLSVLLKNPGE